MMSALDEDTRATGACAIVIGRALAPPLIRKVEHCSTIFPPSKLRESLPDPRERPKISRKCTPSRSNGGFARLVRGSYLRLIAEIRFIARLLALSSTHIKLKTGSATTYSQPLSVGRVGVCRLPGCFGMFSRRARGWI